MYSESFTLRAPKRQSGVRKKDLPLASLRSTISKRPPATLPCTAEVNLQDSGVYTNISSNTFSPDDFYWSSDKDSMYSYVQRKPFNLLRPSSASAVVTKGKSQYTEQEEFGSYKIYSN